MAAEIKQRAHFLIRVPADRRGAAKVLTFENGECIRFNITLKSLINTTAANAAINFSPSGK